ncbi:MAG: protein kinase [Pseudomonadota bacterium]
MSSAQPQTAHDDGDEFVDELKPGTELLHGQYRIESFLNAGGFGITYMARDSLDRKVVIKECFPGAFCRRSRLLVQARSRAHQPELESIVRLFVQEARSLAKLEHPNIVGVHQVFEDNNTAYMALDFVEGQDMLDILEDTKVDLEPLEVKSMLRKLLDAISFVHDQGMLHRDISPDNILLDANRNPILIDFGAAREQASKKSRVLSALRVVKDGYSPQEFYVQGSEQGPSSDLYALGASFYHIITGEIPPDSQTRLAAIAGGEPDPYDPLEKRIKGYDRRFLSSIDTAMEVLPKDRMQSAQEWLDALDRKRSRPLTRVTRNLGKEEKPEAKKKRPVMAIALGSVAVIGLVAAGVLTQMPSGTSEQAETAAAPANDGSEDFALATPVAPEIRTPDPLVLEEAGVAGPTIVGEPAVETETDVVAALPPTELFDSEVAVAPPTGEAADEPLSVIDDAPELLAEAQPTVTADDALAEVSDEPPVADPTILPELTGEQALAEVAIPKAELLTVPETGADEVLLSERSSVMDSSIRPPVRALPEETPAEPEIELPVPSAQFDIAGLTPAEAPAASNTSNFAASDDQSPARATVPQPGDFEPVENIAIETAPTEPPVREIVPTVRFTAVAPTPIQPEVQPLVRDVSSVMSAWSVDLPFTAASGELPTVGRITGRVPGWLTPGVPILAVNGTTVAGIEDIVPVLRSSVTLGDESEVTMLLATGFRNDGSPIEQELTLPIIQDTALLNGAQFETRFVNGAWKTTVVNVPDSLGSELEAGDEIVAYIPTSELIDGRQTLKTILDRELSAGVTSFSFAVQRDGAMWVGALNYSNDLNN